MIIDFLTYNLKKKLAQEVERAESAETALKIDSFAGANWNASGKTIDFYNGFGDMIDSIDASDFIIDGMIEDVYLSGTDLCIIFNTDAGQQDIVIDLTSFINPANYYTKDETDDLIDAEEARALSAETIIENSVEELSGGVSTLVNTVVNSLATRVDEIEEVTAIALNELHDDVVTLSGQLDSKQDVLSAGTNVTITDNVISVNIDTSNFVLTNDLRTLEEVLSTAINNLNSRLTALENA